MSTPCSREYFARASKVIDSHGGTVEKFIGDAVVGVFGVPHVHEDDPERAVRAGLRIIESLEGMTRPDGSPLAGPYRHQHGRSSRQARRRFRLGRGFLTGDAVNVAARLQAAAPPDGVAVGQLVRDLTQRVIVFEEIATRLCQGQVRARCGVVGEDAAARTGMRTAGAADTPFLGRDPSCVTF